MARKKSSKKSAITKNIARLFHKGYKLKHAIAIAFSEAGLGRKRKKK